MIKQRFFPFAAVVGQDNVKQALLIASMNPKVGGVLINGEKGTAKSSLVRALSDIVPDKEIIVLPLNATEDMVFGNIDIEYAMTSGKKVFLPGILARAHGQILYIDEINLLRREILAGVLNAGDRGVNVVEREGISHQHEVNFTLIGTMNPEEGNLTPAVLDRFGLFVSATGEIDVAARTEIVRRTLAYEKEPELFYRKYEAKNRELSGHLQAAGKLLGTIKVSSAMIELAAQYAIKAHSAGHRAEFFLVETAKAIAALAGRNYLLPDDMERAAFFVLPHRLRQEEVFPPEDGVREEIPGDTVGHDNQHGQLNRPIIDDHSSTVKKDNSNSEQNESNDISGQHSDNAAQKNIADIDKNFLNEKLNIALPHNRHVRQGSGRRSLARTQLKQGRYVRSCLPNGKVTDLAFDATLRAAAPYQRLRKTENCCIIITPEDLRQKVREKRIGNTFLFVVDASGSMGAMKRMRAVKGAIFSMLYDAYQKRDRVGLIAFRRQTADVLLPVTRSVDLAQKCLQQLPTGGKTPLAEGLATAFSVLTSMRKKEKEMQPVLVLVTDGRANRSMTGGGDAIADAVKVATKIGMAGFPSVVIDTETDFVKFGVAGTVAREMGSAYYRLTELSEQGILHIVKNF